jgi:polyhydroxyalkanoate synthesis regulator phasin
MKITQRIQAVSVTHPLSMNRKIDQYLSEKLPDMMDEYKIADRSDISDLDKKMGELENRMDELDNWRDTFTEKLGKDESRMARLKVKYGVK